MKGMKHDKVTTPAREKYIPPPCMKTQAPGIWTQMPQMSQGIGGKYHGGKSKP